MTDMPGQGKEDERDLGRRRRNRIANIALLVVFILVSVGQALDLYSALIAGFLVAITGGARGALLLRED